jgi:hypothetical protein
MTPHPLPVVSPDCLSVNGSECDHSAPALSLLEGLRGQSTRQTHCDRKCAQGHMPGWPPHLYRYCLVARLFQLLTEDLTSEFMIHRSCSG